MGNPVTMRNIAKNSLILFLIPGFLFLPILNCCLIKNAAASTPFFSSYAHPGGERGRGHCAGRGHDTDGQSSTGASCECAAVAAVAADQKINDTSSPVNGFGSPYGSPFHHMGNNARPYNFHFYFFQRFRSRAYTRSVPLYLESSVLRI